MNEQNLCRRIGEAAIGDGFKRSKNVNVLSEIRDASGLLLTAATVPAIAALETNFYGLNCVATETHCGMFHWTVPEDYDDEDQDYAALYLLCQMAGNTDTEIHLNVTAYLKRAGTAIATVVTAVASTEHVPSGATATIAADVLKFERSGMGLHPGDVLNFVLTSDVHAADDLYIYGAEMIYRSNLAFSDESDR